MPNFFIKEQHMDVQQSMPALADMNIPAISSGNQNIEFVKSIAEKLYSHKQEMNDVETTLYLQDLDNKFRVNYLSDPNYANTKEGREYVRNGYNALIEEKKKYLQNRKKDIGDVRFLQQVTSLKNQTAHEVEKFQYQENHGFIMDTMSNYSNNMEIIKDNMWNVGTDENAYHENIINYGGLNRTLHIINGDTVDVMSQGLNQIESSHVKGIVNLMNNPQQFLKSDGTMDFVEREKHINDAKNSLLNDRRLKNDTRVWHKSLNGRLSEEEIYGMLKGIREQAFDDMLNKNAYHQAKQAYDDQIKVKIEDQQYRDEVNRIRQDGTVNDLSSKNQYEMFNSDQIVRGNASLFLDKDSGNLNIEAVKEYYNNIEDNVVMYANSQGKEIDNKIRDNIKKTIAYSILNVYGVSLNTKNLEEMQLKVDDMILNGKDSDAINISDIIAKYKKLETIKNNIKDNENLTAILPTGSDGKHFKNFMSTTLIGGKVSDFDINNSDDEKTFAMAMFDVLIKSGESGTLNNIIGDFTNINDKKALELKDVIQNKTLYSEYAKKHSEEIAQRYTEIKEYNNAKSVEAGKISYEVAKESARRKLVKLSTGYNVTNENGNTIFKENGDQSVKAESKSSQNVPKEDSQYIKTPILTSTISFDPNKAFGSNKYR